MSKMREAFERYYATKPWPTCFDFFEAGYQAAIADVKAGGAVAVISKHSVCLCDDCPPDGTKLYKLPEDV